MIALPILLVTPAKEAGIQIPENLEEYDSEKFPHWHIYSLLQLGRPLLSNDSVWNNAKRIANIPTSEIVELTYFKADALLE